MPASRAATRASSSDAKRFFLAQTLSFVRIDISGSGHNPLAAPRKACHSSAMIKATLPALLILFTGACAEQPCAPPRADWVSSGKADDVLTIDSQDRTLWNGEIISFERLRDTLNKADAEAHVVRLAPVAGAGCEIIEKSRVAMERSLSCVQGRCMEAAATGAR